MNENNGKDTDRGKSVLLGFRKGDDVVKSCNHFL